MKTNPKPLALFQQTRFCDFIKEKVFEKYKDAVLLESYLDHVHASQLAAGNGKKNVVMLVWGNGTNHHHSNALNIEGSVKYVFDNHGDDLERMELSYDSHNFHSRKQGVLLRVCHSLGRRMNYFNYDDGLGNGNLHASVDLDFVKGFPALPWMSVGENEFEDLHGYLKVLSSVHQLRRFDIGGFHDLDRSSRKEMESVYLRYYEKLISIALSA